MQEFALIYEARRPRRDDEYKGRLSETDLEGLYKLIHKDD